MPWACFGCWKAAPRSGSRDVEAFMLSPNLGYEQIDGESAGMSTSRRRKQTWHQDLHEVSRIRGLSTVSTPESIVNFGESPLGARCRDCIIDPTDNVWLDAWDVQMVVMLLCTALLTPYESAFLDPTQGATYVFDRCLDVLYIIDMLIKFFTAYPNPRNPERLVKVHSRIIWHYLRHLCLIDLLTLLPFDDYCRNKWSFLGTMEVMGMTTLEVVRVVRLVRLLRLIRLPTMFSRWSMSFGFSYASLTLMKDLASVVFCCHWTACLWGGFALHLERHEEVNWLAALKSAKGGEDSLYTEHWSVYGLALYWAIISLTSIGYGDITPQGNREYWLASACTSLMSTLWAYVIGSFCSVVSTLQPHEIYFKRTMDDLNWLLSERGMPLHMRKLLRRYFHEARDMNKQRVEESVIEQMSPMLQGEFSMFLHSRWITKVWYLAPMNREIIIWAARNLSLMIYAPGEEILEERTLFIVRRGMCAHRGKILTSGDVWGEDMLLSNDVLRDKNKGRSLSYLSVLRLHVADLMDIVIAFPEAKIQLRIAQVRIATMRGIIVVAKTLKRLEDRGLIDLETLPAQRRWRLYREILSGDFDQEALLANQTLSESQANTLGLRSTDMRSGADSNKRSTSALLDRLAPSGSSGTRRFEKQVTITDELEEIDEDEVGPFASVPKGRDSSAEPDTSVHGGAQVGQEAVTKLTAAITKLQEHMERIEEKVDNLSGAGLPARHSSSRRSVADSRTSVDFGHLHDSLPRRMDGNGNSYPRVKRTVFGPHSDLQAFRPMSLP